MKKYLAYLDFSMDDDLVPWLFKTVSARGVTCL